MAYALKNSFRVISRQCQALTAKSHCLASLDGLICRRWMYAGSSEHTLIVRQQIQETRKRGQEAGGAKRIESQHKKVVNQGLLTQEVKCWNSGCQRNEFMTSHNSILSMVSRIGFSLGGSLTLSLTLCGLTGQKTHQGGPGLGGSVRPSLFPLFCSTNL